AVLLALLLCLVPLPCRRRYGNEGREHEHAQHRWSLHGARRVAARSTAAQPEPLAHVPAIPLEERESGTGEGPWGERPRHWSGSGGGWRCSPSRSLCIV